MEEEEEDDDDDDPFADPGRLRIRLHACCESSRLLDARIVRRMAGESMTSAWMRLLEKVERHCCRAAMASQTGWFISQCQARPLAVRAAERFGIVEM